MKIGIFNLNSVLQTSLFPYTTNSDSRQFYSTLHENTNPYTPPYPKDFKKGLL